MFAKNIRFLRKRAELSQDKLAEMLGYKSFTTIQKWESGVSEPSMATAQKIANLFHVDIDDLIKVDLEARGEKPEGYYFDDDTAALAQQIYEDKELRALFDAARDADPEALQAAQAMLKVLKRKERGS
ncbi:MAG: helix-turn-helix transcriptional regulator [Lachnospiraceae bacterium]|nr:helix-turn-helix transcriptional regulator [Lachnospiraceae bacterium]